MIYGYIRVSSDKQTTENQRFEINRWCGDHNHIVHKWINETVSGTVEIKKRQLGKVLKQLKSEDVLICSELSRLGRTLFMIMEVLNFCMQRNVKVWTIKDNYRLGDDISSKVLAFAFGLAAEIERNLISQRTKEALARKRAEGVVLGRPKGSKTAIQKRKLLRHEKEIRRLLKLNIPQTTIAKLVGVHRQSILNYIKEFGDHGMIPAQQVKIEHNVLTTNETTP